MDTGSALSNMCSMPTSHYHYSDHMSLMGNNNAELGFKVKENKTIIIDYIGSTKESGLRHYAMIYKLKLFHFCMLCVLIYHRI